MLLFLLLLLLQSNREPSGEALHKAKHGHTVGYDHTFITQTQHTDNATLNLETVCHHCSHHCLSSVVARGLHDAIWAMGMNWRVRVLLEI